MYNSVGQCEITYTQAGNASYAAAPSKGETLNVLKGDQTITFNSTAPSDAVVQGPTYSVVAQSTSGEQFDTVF